jgi:ABC-type ATPase involved in cell division
MVQSPAEPSGNVDERASASAMQLLAITIWTGRATITTSEQTTANELRDR